MAVVWGWGASGCRAQQSCKGAGFKLPCPLPSGRLPGYKPLYTPQNLQNPGPEVKAPATPHPGPLGSSSPSFLASIPWASRAPGSVTSRAARRVTWGREAVGSPKALEGPPPFSSLPRSLSPVVTAEGSVTSPSQVTLYTQDGSPLSLARLLAQTHILGDLTRPWREKRPKPRGPQSPP